MSWIITYTGQRFDLLAHHLDLWPCLAGIPPLYPPARHPPVGDRARVTNVSEKVSRR